MTTTIITDVSALYHGSNGEATKALYAELEKLGSRGLIALNLFRASKASARAKVYRRKFKGVSYEKKNWSLKLLGEALSAQPLNPSTSQLVWGWREDPDAEYYKWVLYVDLPTGQVSFHAAAPTSDRRYSSDWDGYHLSTKRIIAFADHILNGTPASLILQPCRKCGAGVTAYPGGRGADVCGLCAIEPATRVEIGRLTQAHFALG